METQSFISMGSKKYMLKVPVQKRSRETVASIINACSELLLTDSFSTITTDRIAEKAGVSIGSLYQFFANKESIVAAVVDELLEQDLFALKEGFKTLPYEPETRLKAMIDLAFSRFHVQRELRTALQNAQGISDYWESRKILFEFYQNTIMQFVPYEKGRDHQLVSWIIISAFNSALQISLMNQLNSEKEAQLKGEFYKLLSRYITPEAQ